MNMSKRIFGIRIDDPTPDELASLFDCWLRQWVGRVIVTPNAEFLLEARGNEEFSKLLNASDLSVADSVSILYACAALSPDQMENRYQGVDLIPKLCAVALATHSRVMLLGGKHGAAELSAQQLKKQMPGLDIIAHDPGYIQQNGNELLIAEQTIEHINRSGAQIVIVALGQVKQERFIYQVKESCPQVKIWIGVGGALEMISGQKRRAHPFFTTTGLEWFWRFLIEPSRWRRICRAVIWFPLIVVMEAYRQRTLFKSTKRVFVSILKQFHII